MRRSLVHVGFLLLGCACGSTSSTTPPGTDAGTTGDTGVTPGDTGVVGTGIPGDEYCRPLSVGVTCRAPNINTCGVCVPPSPASAVLERTNCDDTQRREYCGSGSGVANLQCFQPGHYPTAGVSQQVTMWGYVKVFGNGGDSQHIKISVHRVNEDGTPGEMLGTTVSDTAHPAAGTEDVFSPSRDRVLFTRRTGGYAIPNLPTETELLVITEGDPADSEASGLWSHRIYDYNVVILNPDVDTMAAPTGVTGAHTARFLARVISNSDWTAIPATSTLTSGITVGRGALAGEVHDCDDIRLANATVESNPHRAWDGPVVYFSENDTNPLPDLSRAERGTSLLGTYALLDLEPGPVRVSAVGYAAAGQAVHLGSYRARVYPDSVTTVTFRGLRPWQVPAQ